MKQLLPLLLLLALPLAGRAQPKTAYPAPVEANFAIKNFAFASGEKLPVLNLHYATVGQPRKDAQGRVVNAVVIMHGTTGSGQQFLSEQFGGHLFGPGQLLDAICLTVDGHGPEIGTQAESPLHPRLGGGNRVSHPAVDPQEVGWR